MVCNPHESCCLSDQQCWCEQATCTQKPSLSKGRDNSFGLLPLANTWTGWHAHGSLGRHDFFFGLCSTSATVSLQSHAVGLWCQSSSMQQSCFLCMMPLALLCIESLLPSNNWCHYSTVYFMARTNMHISIFLIIVPINKNNSSMITRSVTNCPSIMISLICLALVKGEFCKAPLATTHGRCTGFCCTK